MGTIAKFKKTPRDLNPWASHCLHICFVIGIALISSCKSATESGHNTALDSIDLIKMTDDMAMKIASDPEVQKAMPKTGL